MTPPTTDARRLVNIMIEGLPHTSISDPIDTARNSCAMNMEILRNETAFPFVSLEWGHGRVRSVPESCREMVGDV